LARVAGAQTLVHQRDQLAQSVDAREVASVAIVLAGNRDDAPVVVALVIATSVAMVVALIVATPIAMVVAVIPILALVVVILVVMAAGDHLAIANQAGAAVQREHQELLSQLLPRAPLAMLRQQIAAGGEAAGIAERRVLGGNAREQ